MAAPSASSPVFVGRDRELGIIRSLLDRSAVDEARSLVVSGDAGVGKTALVTRACAGSPGHRTILFGGCLPLTSMSIPLLPIRSALRGLVGEYAPIDLTDAGAEVGRGERDVAVRFDAWLDLQCAVEPVVLVIDDVQWADRSTLDALMYVMAGPAQRRLAVIATLRAGEVGLGHPLQRWLADIRRLPRASELELLPLDRAGTTDQIQELIWASPHQSLVEEVFSRTRGNPYFTRLMVAGLPPDAREAPGTFPTDLSSAVLQSWYRLSDETRHLATVLAVGGSAMRADELADVAGDVGGVAATRSGLLEAADAGTLDRQGDGSFWFHHPMNAEVLEATLGDDERREWHRRFADWHERRIGGGSVHVGTAVAIADHRYRAGQARAAYDWALTAADAAGAASASAEQLRLLRRAVALRSGLPDAVDSIDELLRRVQAVAADAGATADELEAVEALLDRIKPETDPLGTSELLVRRMHLRFMTGQSFIEVGEMQEAVLLARADPRSPEYALALAELAHAELWSGDPAAAEHARRSVAAARATGDPRSQSHALAASSMAALFAEDRATAASLAQEAAAFALAARDWWGYVHAALWECNAIDTWSCEAYAAGIQARRLELASHGGPHAYIAWLSAAEASDWLAIGYWRECNERLRVALGSDPGPLGDVHARLTAARSATLQGRQAEAEGHMVRADELVVDGSAFLALEFDAVRAEVRLGAHDTSGAFRAALTGATGRGAPPTMCEWLMPLAARALADEAQAMRDAGRSAAGPLRALDELVERFPHVIRDIGPMTEIWEHQITAHDEMYRAERSRARASADEADAWSSAADRCAAGRLAWEEVYSCWRAAEALLGRAGDRRAGAELLRRGFELAVDLHARPVELELRDLATRARIPIAHPEPASAGEPGALPGLTAREREILALVAVGRTYAEIARELVISEKTVSTHVSHLLAKTGTANRVELAGLVHRVGPDR